MIHKRCTKCGEEKDVALFYLRRGFPGPWCKSCQDVASRSWRERNPDKHRARSRRSMEADRSRDRDKHRARNREWFKANPDFRLANPSMHSAGRKLRYAVESGRIHRPDSCSSCGSSGRIEAHHPDYSKPLEVVWLCSKCHGLTRRIDKPLATQEVQS